MGVALGAQVGHLVTYRDPWWDPTLHRFYQKVSKTVQNGGTPLFVTYLGGVHARRLEKVELFLHPAMFNGEIIDLRLEKVDSPSGNV